jgi:hypothetical protein
LNQIIQDLSHIHMLLVTYEVASRHQVNHEKTTLFFSRNTSPQDKTNLVQGTSVSPTSHYEKYLGLPALIGRSRVSTFNGIKGHIWNRINGWKEKFISHAGKEILLKSVI